MTKKANATDTELKKISETEGWVDVGEPTKRRAHWQKLAQNTLDQGRIRISLAVREDDLARLKAEALRTGIPYQTLINSLIREHVRGNVS